MESEKMSGRPKFYSRKIRVFISHHNVHAYSAVHTSSYRIDTGFLSLRLKRLDHEANHSVPEVKNWKTQLAQSSALKMKAVYS